MEKEMLYLIEISRYYGTNKDYVLAGGGNTSYKNDALLWVKASEISLANIDEDGFVCLSRLGLKKISTSAYSNNSQQREEKVKRDLNACVLSDNVKRPSVETSLHEVIDFHFVVHTHPTLVNAVLCSEKGKEKISTWFGNHALFVEYTDPGYVLFKKVLKYINEYESRFNSVPQIIFLENHGVFVAANTIEEIKTIYKEIEQTISKEIVKSLPETTMSVNEQDSISGIIESATGKKTLFAVNPLIIHFAENRETFGQIARPFTPDNIVYCKSKYLFNENLNELLNDIQLFEKENGYIPKIILLKANGLLTLEETERAAQTALEVFEDMMKVSYLSNNFGGPKFMTPEQIDFIGNWEVENYRRKIAKK